MWVIIYRDGFLVPIVTVCTSFFAGFVVFSALGFMAHAKGITDPQEFDKVVQGGQVIDLLLCKFRRVWLI